MSATLNFVLQLLDKTVCFVFLVTGNVEILKHRRVQYILNLIWKRSGLRSMSCGRMNVAAQNFHTLMKCFLSFWGCWLCVLELETTIVSFLLRVFHCVHAFICQVLIYYLLLLSACHYRDYAWEWAFSYIWYNAYILHFPC